MQTKSGSAWLCPVRCIFNKSHHVPLNLSIFKHQPHLALSFWNAHTLTRCAARARFLSLTSVGVLFDNVLLTARRCCVLCAVPSGSPQAATPAAGPAKETSKGLSCLGRCCNPRPPSSRQAPRRADGQRARETRRTANRANARLPVHNVRSVQERVSGHRCRLVKYDYK